VAAERTHHDFVYCLIDEMNQLNLTREEMIEAEELLGASFLNDKDHYDLPRGYNILIRAMKRRYEILFVYHNIIL